MAVRERKETVMARYSFSDPNIDRVIDRGYENYVDRLLDEHLEGHGECCENCRFYVSAWKDVPAYCNKTDIEDLEDDEFDQAVAEHEVDPDYCCMDWEYNDSLFSEEEE